MNESNKSRTVEEMSEVTLLGNNNTKYSCDYNPEVLETFVNKHPDNDYVVTFDAYEFTSKCPKTGQPDFAKVVISYIPNERMVYLSFLLLTMQIQNSIIRILQSLECLMQSEMQVIEK